MADSSIVKHRYEVIKTVKLLENKIAKNSIKLSPANRNCVFMGLDEHTLRTQHASCTIFYSTDMQRIMWKERMLDVEQSICNIRRISVDECQTNANPLK